MLLVDGYNLLFQFRPGLRSTGPTDRDRHELVGLLARWCSATRGRARVYFDPGRGHRGPELRARTGPVEVIHLGSGDADGAILDELAATKDITSLRVVSSDRRVSDGAAARGFPVIGAAEFLEEAARLEGPRVSESREKEEGISGEAADAWMKEFGIDGE